MYVHVVKFKWQLSRSFFRFILFKMPKLIAIIIHLNCVFRVYNYIAVDFLVKFEWNKQTATAAAAAAVEFYPNA